MVDPEKSEVPPEGWPRCEPEQVQVMLLGTYHMDNPGHFEEPAENVAMEGNVPHG